MDGSFITLNRKILDWEWYSNSNVMRVFIHCLLKANWKKKKWQGTTIPRGSFITSQGKIADELGLSRKQVMLALDKLIESGELTKNGDNKRTTLTIVKYGLYQPSFVEEGQQKDNKRTSKGQQKDTTNNSNNNNNSNNSNKEIIDVDVVYSHIDDIRQRLLQNAKYVEAITSKFGLTVSRLQDMYLEFNDHLTTMNDTVKSEKDYAKHFLSWICKRYNYNLRTGKQKSIHRNVL